MADIDDSDRAKFLEALDDSDENVSDWEAGFIESNIGRGWYSPKVREIIDRMMEQYPDV